MKHVDLIKSLISIKSYSGEEKEISSFIAQWFKERKIKCVIQDGNVIVHLKGKYKNKAFIINSHMDTVSMGDMKWKHGPWSPTLEKGKIIGLGASDMKSGIAASMILAEEMSKVKNLPADLWFTYVVMEEIDGTGTQKFAKWFKKQPLFKNYSDIAAIFTEPTGLQEIEHGHRGNIFLKVISIGDSGHAARPSLLKKHSVREMIKFADLLNDQFKIWQKSYSSQLFGPPTVGEITSIQAGVTTKKSKDKYEVVVDSPNKFPSTCIATFDVRTNPKFHDTAFEKIVTLGKKHGFNVEHAFPPSPAGFTDPSSKIIKIAKSVIKKAGLVVSQGAADLGFLTSLGVKAIILGPGEKTQAHKVNEYAFLNQIPQAVKIYSEIIIEWSK